MKNSPKNTSNKVYLDTNVLLEVILDRKHAEAARSLILKNANNLAISALTVHLVVYFCNKVANISDIRVFLAGFEIVPLDTNDIEWAYNNRQDNDFEDALQISSAIKCGADSFYTLDKSLYNNYKHLSTIGVELVK